MLLHRVARQVVRVMNDMRRVVALEHQHELQILAKVILTQTETVLQGSLVITARHASHKSHFGTVIEPYTVQRFD